MQLNRFDVLKKTILWCFENSESCFLLNIVSLYYSCQFYYLFLISDFAFMLTITFFTLLYYFLKKIYCSISILNLLFILIVIAHLGIFRASISC